MRRSLGKFSNPTIGNATKHTLLSSSSYAFSTSAGGGGRGRGRGSSSSSDFPTLQFNASTPGKVQTESDDSKNESPSQSGLGHGRGKPLPSTSIPILPSFPSFASGSGMTNTSAGRGRGRGTIPPQSEPSGRPQEPQHSGPKKPIFFLKEDGIDSPKAPIGDRVRNPEESNLPSSILSVLSGAGRGKPAAPTAAVDKVKGQNRHIRVRQPGVGRSAGVSAGAGESPAPPAPRLSIEDAVRQAVGILTKAGDGDRLEDGGRGRGGFRGRGSRGRGGGRGVQGWRGRGGRGRRAEDSDEDDGTGLYLGDDADGEKLAKRIGTENNEKLFEGFQEIGERVLPCPMQEAYLDALHTNYMIECEPEYLMEEFGTNPDIDEKPAIPLRDALEKMKPFLMAYNNIQSHEEWEEVMKETMERVPLLKEIVDYYSGPDRVTAKRQQEELERVAKTLPASAPNSVKRFTTRAVLSLQSNPGWGFDKKCQFMDKLVREVSQQYT